MAREFDVVIIGAGPVSYTHLDVYKRQGEHTRSLRIPGCVFVFNTIFPAPMRHWAARLSAASRLSPISTPPSARASIKRYANAGPHPLIPVNGSISDSGNT